MTRRRAALASTLAAAAAAVFGVLVLIGREFRRFGETYDRWEDGQ